MRPKLTGLSELRLIMHGYPTHTTVALVTRERNGSENWDRRAHSWDLRLPQGNYEGLKVEDQLWAILGELAAKTLPLRATGVAQPPASPEGDRRGEQLLLDLDCDHF